MGNTKFNIVDALFSKVQQRVLGLIFGQPNRSFYTNEIIRLSHSGTGAVQRELRKLECAGLIIMKQSGNQKLYQANRDMPFFSELHSIILKTFGLADILKDVLIPFTSQILFAFIYGSFAKQEDHAKSDVDLMLIGNNLNYIDLFPHLETAQAKIGRQINPTCYTPEEWARKKKAGNHFITQIIKQPKIFLVGSENDLIAFG